MSYSSLWVINQALEGQELYKYANSWLFNPNCWDAMAVKYVPPDPRLSRMGHSNSIILDQLFEGDLWSRVNRAVNECDNTADRIGWEVANGSIMMTRDKDLISRSILDFFRQNQRFNKSMQSETVFKRFQEIADDIAGLDAEAYPYFVIHGSSCDDYVEAWFRRENPETGESEEITLDQYKGYAEITVISHGKVAGFVPISDWDWEQRKVAANA